MDTKRFWALVDKSSPRDCWMWKGPTHIKGNGRFFADGRWQSAHRLMWQLTREVIPDGFSIYRICGNRLCLNPNHLGIGHSGIKPASGMELASRFWEKVVVHSDCWLWTGSQNRGGYGIFNNGLAHRFSWSLVHGSIPKGLQICHVCDVRACVKPEHLFLGSQQDNVSDMHQKGRQRHLKGQESGSSKLTELQVLQIRDLYELHHFSQQHLAERFGVSQRTVSFIVRRQTWKLL